MGKRKRYRMREIESCSEELSELVREVWRIPNLIAAAEAGQTEAAKEIIRLLLQELKPELFQDLILQDYLSKALATIYEGGNVAKAFRVVGNRGHSTAPPPESRISEIFWILQKPGKKESLYLEAQQIWSTSKKNLQRIEKAFVKANSHLLEEIHNDKDDH